MQCSRPVFVNQAKCFANRSFAPRMLEARRRSRRWRRRQELYNEADKLARSTEYILDVLSATAPGTPGPRVARYSYGGASRPSTGPLGILLPLPLVSSRFDCGNQHEPRQRRFRFNQPQSLLVQSPARTRATASSADSLGRYARVSNCTSGWSPLQALSKTQPRVSLRGMKPVNGRGPHSLGLPLGSP